MINYEKRNSEIVQMRKRGISYREIAKSFGLSYERIRRITLHFELEKRRKERSEKLRKTFRSSDDIDKRWSKEEILDCLLFQGRAYLCMKRYFDSHDITKARLRDVMDFLVSDYEELPANQGEAMPAYKQKGVGAKTYASLVHHLSGQDLGDSFNTEWQKRLEKLMRYLTKYGQHVPLLLRRYLL